MEGLQQCIPCFGMSTLNTFFFFFFFLSLFFHILNFYLNIFYLEVFIEKFEHIQAQIDDVPSNLINIRKLRLFSGFFFLFSSQVQFIDSLFRSIRLTYFSYFSFRYCSDDFEISIKSHMELSYQ
jgi:hypothetical protein